MRRRTCGDDLRGVHVTLELRGHCERCGTTLTHEADAVICSYECTFCRVCGETLEYVCPNCGGELVARPKRVER